MLLTVLVVLRSGLRLCSVLCCASVSCCQLPFPVLRLEKLLASVSAGAGLCGVAGSLMLLPLGSVLLLCFLALVSLSLLVDFFSEAFG